MQPFELPDFYVPWPARLNPNLDIARAYSKEWAREMGILDAPSRENTTNIWSEEAFDKHDYALFCAYIHPEAPVSELNLMTAWNVWAFYVDDYFLKVYKRPKDHAGAKQYLDRILIFMPIDLHASPEPTNPMERGLMDLWLRTAPAKSEAWRGRITKSMKNLLEAFIWELDSISQQRLANPIEYIEMRRQVGAALWSADLVEHAMSIEIPDRIANTRPMQVLKATFADAVHLRNDIFSYEREVIKDGELTNAVLVIERFLDVNTQNAANLVNDLLTSRLQQFEHTVFVELGPIFEEYQLDVVEQANVLTYIRGLQDWQSGAHEWHVQTSRYLNPHVGQASPTIGMLGMIGLGTAAARITPGTLGLNRFKNYMHTPKPQGVPIELPKFHMPFTTQMNPNLDAAREHSKTWAREMGMLDKLPDYPAGFIWDDYRFDVTDLAFFSALFHPNATASQLDLEMDWLVWGTYTDDYFVAVYGHNHNLAGAKICHARMLEFMPLDAASPVPIPINPVERGLADVWVHTIKTIPTSEQHLFRKIIHGMIGSWVWELSNQVQNYIPDPIEYFEMRRKTSGSDQLLYLSRSVYGEGVPSEIHQTLTMQELNNSAIDCACLTNDIFSYEKEVEFDGEIHNAVLVIQTFMGCNPMQAVNIVNMLITARMEQFEHIAATELPVLFDNFDLDTKAREQLLGYVEELKHFMCSNIQWHIRTARYKEIEFRRSTKPKSFSDKPTGLGTTAAHLLGMVNSKNGTDKTMQSMIPLLPAQVEIIDTETPKMVKTFAVSHLESSFIKKKEEAQLD